MAKTDDADHEVFIVCALDDDSLSPAQRRRAKIYAIGLVAVSNETVASIAREVLSASSKRALNKFLIEYDCGERKFNHNASKNSRNTVECAS